MRVFFLICLFFTSFALAQCRNTFVYGFKIDEKIDSKLIIAQVFYQNKLLISKTKLICGSPKKIKSTFTFLEKTSSFLEGTKLSYQLPAKTFYWLITDDMNIEMATHPDRFKIVIDSKNAKLKRDYQLPQTYDFLSQNAIYLDLNDKSNKNIAKEFTDKVWFLNLSKKETIKEETQIVKDTTLIYSAREKIPEGILVRFPEIRNTSVHSMQEFNTKGMLFNQKIFLKIPESVKSKPDQTKGNYVEINGKKCATSGGITGMGNGECAGAGLTKKMMIYNINIQIEP